MEDCPDPLYADAVNGANLCVEACPYTYFGEDNVCIPTCQIGFADPITRICED